MALLRALQQSLEPAVVVDVFARRLHEHYGVEGVAFDHPEHGCNWGTASRPAFATRLQLDDTALGRLALYRQRAFDARERSELDVLAELLAQPLHNAVRHASLQKQAFEDGLTRLLNRQALDRMLPRELAAAERQGHELAVVMIDLDFLKPINDLWGHAAGDRALQTVAEAINAALRQSDLAFRVGGDEFLLLLPATGATGAATVVARIRQALARMAAQPDSVPHPGMQGDTLAFSAGIAVSAPGVTAEQLVQQADQAMYRAKRAGRNRDRTAAPPRVRHHATPDFTADRAAARLARR
ncbi:GGDEF domain-containing protein [Thioalkalivibrio sp. XN8]|uniref:GGDEF domain-containing protein n=1 Tax=Thioalkalivibrio sp. XN8 TaxID=2712863 RepID=UPI0013EC0A5B|nr:GGDEF domain-containing protein [Thioalkalivibrio sp. XN8]NGP53870.1 GGDEF domain-containing protein [Thioalkalivibrio sp. XN8]